VVQGFVRCLANAIADLTKNDALVEIDAIEGNITEALVNLAMKAITYKRNQHPAVPINAFACLH
jgi:hypothetical protein